MTGASGRRGPTARLRQQWLWAAVAALTAAVLSVAGAAAGALAGAVAHADLVAAEPAAGSTVVGSPSVIRLSFSQPLVGTSRIQLFTGQFVSVPGLTIAVAGSELQAVLSQPLAPATYTVQWLAATPDGHTTEGSYQFGVKPASPLAANWLAVLAAAIATLIGGGVAVFVLILERRQRL